MQSAPTNYLASLSADQIALGIDRARRAEQIHLSGGRLYMAELCGKRADDLASIQAERVAA